MPVVSADIWKILYTVSRYLFPLLSVLLVFLILFYILSESRLRREKVHGLPGSGTIGELIVLSGSRELDVNTWFPVPREGVLGSVRSCDLVIPCPGVHTKHLDFSWEDGTGLLIHPRTGCEVQINGVPVTCRTHASEVPLTHGAVLQVGTALLRLHLFAALDNTVSAVQPFSSEIPVSLSASSQDVFSVQPLPSEMSPSSYDTVPVQPVEPSFEPIVPVFPVVQDVIPSEIPSDSSESSSRAETVPVRLRRSDRWKEDLGE